MMFLAQRLDKIKEILNAYKSIDIASLSNMLEVSDVTIRKDMERLEKEGFLTKIHGGAVLNEKTEIQLPTRDLVKIPGYSRKRSIARAALQLINDDDKIFIGAGTSCLIFADELASREGLSIITNNFNVMQMLVSSENRVIMLGGEHYNNAGNSFFIGSATETQLQDIFVDKAFISVDAIDLHGGLTMTDSLLMNILHLTKNISKELILLADSSKFYKRELHRIGDINMVDCIVTNQDINSEIKEAAFQKNIKIITALEI